MYLSVKPLSDFVILIFDVVNEDRLFVVCEHFRIHHDLLSRSMN